MRQHLAGGEAANGAMLRQLGIVVDHDRPVTRGVDIQLDRVRALGHGGAEGRRGVLVRITRGAAMGDDQGEDQLSSSFRDSIQGSDIMSRRNTRS